jgi:hypothetical protein
MVFRTSPWEAARATCSSLMCSRMSGHVAPAPPARGGGGLAVAVVVVVVVVVVVGSARDRGFLVRSGLGRRAVLHVGGLSR